MVLLAKEMWSLSALIESLQPPIFLSNPSMIFGCRKRPSNVWDSIVCWGCLSTGALARKCLKAASSKCLLGLRRSAAEICETRTENEAPKNSSAHLGVSAVTQHVDLNYPNAG